MILYIDPGTGSMLFAILVSVLGVLNFFSRGLILKLRFLFSGGKAKEDTSGSIPFAIFSDDKRYWQTFEPVCRELDRRGFDVTYLTASADDPALNNPYPHVKAEHIGEGNRAFARLNLLNATMLLATTPGLDVYQWKRSKSVKYYVHMLHGANEVAGYRCFGIDYYDALMLSGEYERRDVRNLEKLRGLPEKEIEMIGVPYLDEMVRRLEQSPPLPAHERTVLLAPTWGASSILNRFGEKILTLLLDTGYRIIVRPHPQSFTSDRELMDRLMAQFPNSERLEWNRDPDNFEVLRRSDVMISDYSGVIFDFSLVFDRPVICADTQLDLSPYDAWWLETPFWTSTAIPRIGPTLSEDALPRIKELIDCSLDDRSYTESRHEVRDETWMYRGEGAVRAADFLMRKYAELTVSTPSQE